MGGSGGSYRYSRSEIDERRREVDEAVRQGRLDAEVNAVLAEKLVDINQRDTQTANERLDEIRDALEDKIEEFDRLVFGGSVSKHTYVEGLSDIDSLVVLDGAEIKGEQPDEVRREFAQLLRGTLNMGEISDIQVGDLAVTVVYKTGPPIQVLPAIDRGGQLSISSPSRNDWMPIEPRRFAQALTELNQSQGGAVVPAIKLAKAVIGNLPEDQRLSGYHMEALALAAFKDYNGARNPKAMVTRFFDRASKDVMRPVSDVSGQSKYVDEKLGAANSGARRALGTTLDRIWRKMSSARDATQWRELLDD
jgi:hypothetical protein